MLPFARIATFFSGAIFVVLVGVAFIGTYYLDEYEAAWGRGASFQVWLWLSLFAWLLSFFGALIGARIAGPRRHLANWIAIVLGVSFLAVTILGSYISPDYSSDIGGLLLTLWFLVVPGAISFSAVRLLGKDLGRDV